MATKTTAAPDQPPTAPPPPPENRFFAWMRALDIPRRPGWIGGVCAGVAARLGIDVVIVRGIAVVIAVLGGPAFLLYAAGWLLLPDLGNRIHLETLIRGTFDRAIAGIAAIVVLGLLPFSQGFWFLGAGYWGDTSLGGSIWRALWTALLIGLGIWFVVWLARRATHSGAETTTAPATTDDRPETIPNAPVATTVADAGPTDAAAPETDAAPAAPAQPASDASAAELADWREKQAAWKLQHEAWKAQQQASDRELMLQRAAEAKAKTDAEAAARAERRRRRRLANPRTSGAAVAITLGVALLAGGLCAFLADGTAWTGHAVTVGFGVAAIVLGLAIVVAGALRRRSGFLGFVALLSLIVTVSTAFLPADRQLVGMSSYEEHPGRYSQPFGSVEIEPNQTGAGQAGLSRVIDVWQGTGSVFVSVRPGTTVLVETTQRKGSLDAYGSDGISSGAEHSSTAPDGTEEYTHTFGSGERPDYIVRISQGAGSIAIQDNSGSDLQ